jgi:hypothetical protein
MIREHSLIKDMEVRYWQHPAEASISSKDKKEEKGSIHTYIYIYTDGIKTDKGVGLGIAIFESGHYIKGIQRRLNKKCTNQAEQLAIMLQYIETTQRMDKKNHNIHRQ